MKTLRVSVLLLCWLCSCGCVSALESLQQKTDVEFTHVFLSEIMQDLGKKAGVRIDCPEAVSAKLGSVTYKGTQQEIGRIASNILRPLGYRLNQEGDSVYTVQEVAKNYEFLSRRVETYEFAEEPKIERHGDRVTIQFEAKAFCDATVAIERSNGKIVRHLASGLLGENAPEPFAWNSKKQTLVWDGKNDQGEYVDEKDDMVVRVSLGLTPRYEKGLFWEPKKRISKGYDWWVHTEDCIPVATPEGVYVYDSNGIDFIRLFDHDGNYVRTVYPFPANKLKEVKGLNWRDYPQGYQRPEMYGLNQTTFLTSGGNSGHGFRHAAAYSMAVLPGLEKDGAGRIALVGLTLNRLATNGGTPGALSLSGPSTIKTLDGKPYNGQVGTGDRRAVPLSCAFSPDGKRLYMSGYSGTISGPSTGHGSPKHNLDGVAYLDYESDEPLKTFKGEFQMEGGLQPCVVCDKQGRVLVSDYIGNCINVFDADGKALKQIAVERPTQICIHPETGELYVFSWYLGGRIWTVHPGLTSLKDKKMPRPSLTILKSVEDPQETARYPLPRAKVYEWGPWFSPWEYCHGTQIRATVDFWAPKLTIWLTPSSPAGNEPSPPWEDSGLVLLQAEGKMLKIVRDFGKEAKESVVRTSVCRGHQRLYTNPANEKLYISESLGGPGGGEFNQLVEIDPNTGKVGLVDLPFSTEDMTFDIDGRAYLRKVRQVVRFDPESWREIAWDYGDDKVIGKFQARSSLELPSAGTVCFSEGGLYVSPKGHLAVSCSNDLGLQADAFKGLRREGEVREATKPYKFPNYPGRVNNPLTACVHVWDRKGKLIIEDAVPGMTQIDGIGIDVNDNIYGMSAASRIYGGTKYLNCITGTLFKVQPGQNKWISDDKTASIPAPKDLLPTRAPDLYGYCAGTVWINGAHWLYGGVGNCSFKYAPGCICWQQSRFTLDYFARSFAPEVDQYSVAVVDSNGNLITRIGKYGNVDDGVPLSKDSKLTPPHPQPLGGDEVALVHASHVATITDKYLYIGDIGNARVVQVKLLYAVDKRIPVKTVADDASKP